MPEVAKNSAGTPAGLQRLVLRADNGAELWVAPTVGPLDFGRPGPEPLTGFAHSGIERERLCRLSSLSALPLERAPVAAGSLPGVLGVIEAMAL